MHTPSNPCPRLALNSAVAGVFEPFNDSSFVALKARPGKLDKEYSVLYAAVSY